MRRYSPHLFALLTLLAGPALYGQVGASGGDPVSHAMALAKTLPGYDVISIHKSAPPSDPNNQSTSISTDDSSDRFSATNAPLMQLVEIAYDVKRDLVSGLASDAASVHYDVEAKVLGEGGGAPPKLSDRQLEAMMISVLADRFHLTAHVQVKTLPVYNLVVVHGGPKVHLAEAPPDASSWNLNRSDRRWLLTGKTVTMAALADALSDSVQRKVIDMTGLTGATDMTLQWTDDAADPTDAATVSVFTAVQEQLGLKLQPAKGPVETLVVDHVELPAAN